MLGAKYIFNKLYALQLFTASLLLFSLNQSYAADTVAAKEDKVAQSKMPLRQTYTPMKMRVDEGDDIVVKGYRGAIEYVVVPTAEDLRAEVRETFSPQAAPYRDDWQFSFKREGSTIFVAVEGPTSKEVWNESLAANAQPEYYVRLTGPSLPLKINWNEGRIVVTNLMADLMITSIHADVIVAKGEGLTSVANQEGLVQISSRKGQVKVDSYQAKVKIENIEGSMELENFTGETQVENIAGDMNLSTFKGVTKLASVKGRLDFKNGNSPLHIEKFEGELRGRSAQGAVFADVRGDANVRVESAEGAVNLRLPASGAWVNVGTEDGAMAVPGFLKQTRLQTQQLRTGRLKGTTGGSVFIRTTSGDIRIR